MIRNSGATYNSGEYLKGMHSDTERHTLQSVEGEEKKPHAGAGSTDQGYENNNTN